jgi:uridylate kinase
MNKPSKRYIISLGGSLIVPDEIDTKFISGFKKVIESGIKAGEKFLLITGGGRTSRRYSEAAKTLGDLNPDDLDWLGIHSTRLNGHLLRTIFRKHAHRRIITNPMRPEKGNEPVMIAAGYRPGWSTDYVAVLLAKKYKAEAIVNLSNIDYVYDKDPRKYKDAKPIKDISWVDFRKIVGDKWDPGLNLPFDPVASKLAEKMKLRVAILNGKNLPNLRNFLANKKFKGTIIT